MDIFSAYKIFQKAKVIKHYLPAFKLASFELRGLKLILFFMPRKSFISSTIKFNSRKKYFVEISIAKDTIFCHELRQYLDWDGSMEVRKVLIKKLRHLADAQ